MPPFILLIIHGYVNAQSNSWSDYLACFCLTVLTVIRVSQLIQHVFSTHARMSPLVSPCGRAFGELAQNSRVVTGSGKALATNII
jgi:hypothetical protein